MEVMRTALTPLLTCRLPFGCAESLVVLVEEQDVAALLAHDTRIRHTDSCSGMSPRSALINDFQRAFTCGMDCCVATYRVTLLPEVRGPRRLFILLPLLH